MTMTERHKPSDGAVNPTVRIRSIMPTLPPAERRVAQGILDGPAAAMALSIGDLALRTATSEATVVRLSKRAGFAGYPDLRLALATQVGRSTAPSSAPLVDPDVGPGDSLADIVAKVGVLDTQAISETIEQLDIARLESVVRAVAGARRIELYGIGASGLVATDLEHKLRRIGLPAATSTDGHAAMTSAAVVTSADVALGISHSGETLDVIDPIRMAGASGASTIAITNFAHSTLARTADLVLLTAATESRLRAGAMASRSAQLTVIDCIYLAVAQRDYDHTIGALEQTSAAVSSRRIGRQGGATP